MVHTKRFINMKQTIEPILGGYTACALALFLLQIQHGEIMLTIGVLAMIAYYLFLTIQGAVKGDLNPVFNHEVATIKQAKLVYVISGFALAFACFAILMRFVEGNTSTLLMLISIALLIISLFRVDYLFHKTNDRRHLAMLYRLGIYSGVVLLAFTINF